MIGIAREKPKTEQEMRTFLEANGYFNVRFLPDGIVANLRLLYTTALVVGIDAWGYEDRHCYGDIFLAQRACNAMKSIDDQPMSGWIAKRTR